MKRAMVDTGILSGIRILVGGATRSAMRSASLRIGAFTTTTKAGKTTR